MPIKRLILDALVPHEPDVVRYADRLSEIDFVTEVTLQVMEIDERTRSVQITIEGDSLSLDRIREAIEELGGSIHSVDSVCAAPRMAVSPVGENG